MKNIVLIIMSSFFLTACEGLLSDENKDKLKDKVSSLYDENEKIKDGKYLDPNNRYSFKVPKFIKGKSLKELDVTKIGAKISFRDYFDNYYSIILVNYGNIFKKLKLDNLLDKFNFIKKKTWNKVLDKGIEFATNEFKRKNPSAVIIHQKNITLEGSDARYFVFYKEDEGDFKFEARIIFFKNGSFYSVVMKSKNAGNLIKKITDSKILKEKSIEYLFKNLMKIVDSIEFSN